MAIKVNTTYTSKQIKSPKWLLHACTLASAAIDLAVIIMLGVGGIGAKYLICPILMFAAESIFFAVSFFFTNYRFRYSLLVWITYLLLSVLLFAIGNALLLGGSGTVITNVALILWECTHALSILSIIICALFASKIIKKIWFAFAVTVVYIFACLCYGSYLFGLGFFGQGSGNRPLVYTYNADADTYAVTDVVKGKSGVVEIPEAFNGKKVNSVDLAVCFNSTVEKVIINSDISFTGVAPSAGSAVKSIEVNKKYANSVRGKLFALAVGAGKPSYLKLANAVKPTGLENGECYVSFRYDERAFDVSNGLIIPVYIGSPSLFNFNNYVKDYPYVARASKTSVADLDLAYRNSGYIFTGATVNGRPIEDAVINGGTVCDLNFEKVYRVTVYDGNDTKYPLREMQPDFCFDRLNGVKINYRYVSESGTDAFLNDVGGREGFTLGWRYDSTNVNSLTEAIALSGGSSEVEVNPVWSLILPKVSTNTHNGSKLFVYGEDVTLQTQVEWKGAEGLSLRYNWKYGGSTISASANTTLTHPTPDESGKYTATVSIDGGSVTSLTGSVSADMELTVGKKPVSFDWTYENNMVYSAANRDVTVAFDEAQLVDGDSFNFKLNGTQQDGYSATWQIKNAGDYNYTLTVEDTDFNSKYIANGLKKTVHISPCALAVNWNKQTKYVYNGKVQYPTASATGLLADGELIDTITCSNKNAGSYYIIAACTNDNYMLTDTVCDYVIEKAPLTVSVADASVTYGSRPSTSPAITYTGFVNGETKSVLSGTATYTYLPLTTPAAAQPYENGIKVSGLSSNNYDITYEDGALTVNVRSVTVTWSGYSSLVYDGMRKSVAAAASGLVNNDLVSVTVTGGNEVNAGSYTAKAVALTGDRAANYELSGTLTRSYTISKRTLLLSWSAPTNMTYDATEKEIAVTAANAVSGDNVALTVTGNKNTNAGSYTARVTAIDSTSSANYVLGSGTSYTYTILKAQAAITLSFNGHAVASNASVVTITTDDVISWTSNFAATCKVNGVLKDSGLSGSCTFTEGGTYTVTVAVAATSNYNAATRTITAVVAQPVEEEENSAESGNS